jgi:hypothetical protein
LLRSTPIRQKAHGLYAQQRRYAAKLLSVSPRSVRIRPKIPVGGNPHLQPDYTDAHGKFLRQQAGDCQSGHGLRTASLAMSEHLCVGGGKVSTSEHVNVATPIKHCLCSLPIEIDAVTG